MSVRLASIISQKGTYTTIMVGELISDYTHTSYTTIFVGELISETCLAGALYGISGVHASSDDIPWKNAQKSIIISTNSRKHPNYDGFL